MIPPVAIAASRARSWCGAALGRAASPSAAQAAGLRARNGGSRVRCVPIRALSKNARPMRELAGLGGRHARRVAGLRCHNRRPLAPGAREASASFPAPRLTPPRTDRGIVVVVEARFG
jgi:hypothetical protein